jgi:oxygen-independent coproporphyrinogen-3 oxidase
MLVQATIDSTLRRARELARRFGSPADSRSTEEYFFDTVYVGGGTPTRLDPDALRTLLVGIGDLISGSPREWTVEANPESLDAEKLDIMAEAGVTRLSVGVQSLDDDALSLLGRPCDASTALRALKLAVAAGFEVSADLLAAIPFSSRYRSRTVLSKNAAPEAYPLAEQVGRLLDLGLPHISIYDLIVEEGTAIAADIALGSLIPPTEDAAADRRDEAETLLADRGFLRYEISNYALSGHECRHNLAYWRMDSWIGAGPGAVSTIAFGASDPLQTRESQSSESPAKRVARGGALRISEWPDIGKMDIPGREESIDPEEAAFETMMMAFRTSRGLDVDAFSRRFGRSPQSLTGETIERWKDRFRKTGKGFLALDERGMDLSNRFLAECLREMEKHRGEA